MKTALLIIDVQQGLCEGKYATFESQRVIANINMVSKKARDAGALVIFIQHESSSGLLAFGSKAWQLADGLHIEPSDLRLRKTASDSFHQTELDALLKQHAITNLIICGMQTEFCVDTTVRRALALTYPVVLVADAHTTEDSEILTAAQIIRHHNRTLTNIDSFGVVAVAVAASDVLI